MINQLVSIIIRTKNEEKWIEACFKSVFSQNYPNYEIILVDNKSTDNTLELIKNYPHKLVSIENFRPGYAINQGIRASGGEIIVILSGHCIPTNKNWLSNLIAGLSDSNVAGVYGRQEPLSTSSPADKRDLLITFGLDSKVQIKDSFFHNANSAVRRETWNNYPFDEDVKHIEDRVWGQKVIDAGFKILYEPMASVYHHHGIHHDGNQERAERIVKILEQLNSNAIPEAKKIFSDLRVSAIIPLKGNSLSINGKKLIYKTLYDLSSSEFISDIYICSDNLLTDELGELKNLAKIISRPRRDDGAIIDVIKHSINEITSMQQRVPHLYVVAQETYPFRGSGFFDRLITSHLNNDDDITIAAKLELRNIWVQSSCGGPSSISESYEPRKDRTFKSYISLFGLGAVLNSGALKKADIKSLNFGIHLESDLFSSIEISNLSDYQYCLDKGIL